MGWLGRWLDPPAVRARKRQMRAAGIHPPRSGIEVGVAIPVGCTVPLAIAAAVLVSAGVLIGARFSGGNRVLPPSLTVRVIDTGAPGGPQVVATQVVPLH
jgi:hypothetical protein